MPSLVHVCGRLYPEALEKPSPAKMEYRLKISRLPYHIHYLKIIPQFEGFSGGIVQKVTIKRDMLSRKTLPV